MIFRTNKITNYTKIDNRYLEDKKIYLKAKGLLTLIFSLSDSWKFNINGLFLLCKESKDAINTAIKELKENYYVEMKTTFDETEDLIMNIMFMKIQMIIKQISINHKWITLSY